MSQDENETLKEHAYRIQNEKLKKENAELVKNVRTHQQEFQNLIGEYNKLKQILLKIQGGMTPPNDCPGGQPELGTTPGGIAEMDPKEKQKPNKNYLDKSKRNRKISKEEMSDLSIDMNSLTDDEIWKKYFN